jgi:hypothetical protein
VIWLLLAIACSTSAPTADTEGELVFVRDGIIAPGSAESGRSVGSDRRLVETPWIAGSTHTIAGITGQAPVRPECVSLFHVPLTDVSRLAASGGVAPDSVVAFSPSGDRLAVGSYQGDVVVVDGWTGREIARTVLPEAVVKRVVWSSDGRTLYVGEQSPDGEVHAMAADTLEIVWSFRSADHVGSSPLPEGEDRYAIFEMPGIYTLRVLGSGDIIAVAVHGWNQPDGSRKNASQVFQLSSSGDILKRWPQQAVSATFLHSVIHEAEDGGTMLMNVGRSADGPAPKGVLAGSLGLFDLGRFEMVSVATLDPLGPWFKSTDLWHAMDVHPTMGLFVGIGDGRAMLKGTLPPHETVRVVKAGTPIMAGKVPISASVGFGGFYGDTLMYTTSDTNIPWGAAVPELRPPSHHPRANGLWVTDAKGDPLWSWQGDIRVQGLSASPNGTVGMIGGGYRSDSGEPSTYGAVLFDLKNPGDGRTGNERRLSTCATPLPVYFVHQVLDDGRVAVVEFPVPDGQGGVRGSYRATVLR